MIPPELKAELGMYLTDYDGYHFLASFADRQGITIDAAIEKIEAKAAELGQEPPLDMRALASDEKLAARYQRQKKIDACEECDSDGFIWVPHFQGCPSCYRQEEDCYAKP